MLKYLLVWPKPSTDPMWAQDGTNREELLKHLTAHPSHTPAVPPACTYGIRQLSYLPNSSSPEGEAARPLEKLLLCIDSQERSNFSTDLACSVSVNPQGRYLRTAEHVVWGCVWGQVWQANCTGGAGQDSRCAVGRAELAVTCRTPGTTHRSGIFTLRTLWTTRPKYLLSIPTLVITQ